MTMATDINIDHLFTAQFGEDRLLWQIFRGRTTGFFMEIGAFDGYHLSNTFFLEQMGWHGLLVEPIQELCQLSVARRPRSRVVQAACSTRGASGTTTFTVAQNVPVLSFLSADAAHVERCRREGANLVEVQVPVTSVNAILASLRAGEPGAGNPWRKNEGWCIDLVSIDTEGCELDVLDGFDLDRFRPRVLLIENDRPAGEALEPYLKGRGYRKFFRQTINDFYVRQDDPGNDLQLDGLIAPPG